MGNSVTARRSALSTTAEVLPPLQAALASSSITDSLRSPEALGRDVPGKFRTDYRTLQGPLRSMKRHVASLVTDPDFSDADAKVRSLLFFNLRFGIFRR